VIRFFSGFLLIGSLAVSIWALPGNALIAAILGLAAALAVGFSINRRSPNADSSDSGMEPSVTRVLQVVSFGLVLVAAICVYKVLGAQYPFERSLFGNAAGVAVGGALSVFFLSRKSLQ
jgi:hypothetical protein